MSKKEEEYGGKRGLLGCPWVTRDLRPRRRGLGLRFFGGEYERGHAGADDQRSDRARDNDGLLAFGRNLRRWGMNDLLFPCVGDARRDEERQAHQNQENAVDPQPQNFRASHLLHASRRNAAQPMRNLGHRGYACRSFRSDDENVAGAEQRCEGNNAHYDAPEQRGALC